MIFDWLFKLFISTRFKDTEKTSSQVGKPWGEEVEIKGRDCSFLELQ